MHKIPSYNLHIGLFSPVDLNADTGTLVFVYSSRSLRRIHIRAFYASCIRANTHIGRSFCTVLAASACIQFCFGKWATHVSWDMLHLLGMIGGLLSSYKTRIQGDLDLARTSIPVLERVQI